MFVSANIAEHAGALARDFDIDSACIHISDKTTSNTQLHFLGSFGVSEEVLERYRADGVCDCDPFTDVRTNEAPDRGRDRTFFDARHPEIAGCGPTSEKYWQFVSAHEIDVVGASTLRLQPRLYLTIGAHRIRGRRRRRAVSMERLGHSIEAFQGRIVTQLLSSLLSESAGHRALVSILMPKATGSAVNCLSRRETELAQLVCEGRQNKEIAFLAGLSEYTVENYLRRIYRKLGIHNRAALVACMNGAQL